MTSIWLTLPIEVDHQTTEDSANDPFRTIRTPELTMNVSLINKCSYMTIFLIALFVNWRVSAEDIYQNPDSERRIWPYTADVPACDDPFVLRKIIHDFEKREREFWNTGLFISEFKDVVETGQRIHGLDYTPRRYCKTVGIFGDGHERNVYYNITPDQSIILSGQIIDWCIQGLDRTHVDGPDCRRVRR